MDRFKTEFWKAKLTRHYPILEKSVKRRFRNEPEKASEALSFVSEKLVEDNMRRLSLYDPDRGAKFETYFSVLVQRLISRFIEKNKKRRRFPKWIEKQGNALWELVYRLLCWELKSETDVFEYVESAAPGKRDEHVVQEAVWVIRENFPDCGNHDTPKEMTIHDNYLSGESLNTGPSFHHRTPEEQTAFNQLLEITDAIYAEPAIGDISDTHAPAGISAIKKRLAEKFNPSTEKRLFLKMIYQDGMGVSEAGRMLGWNANQAAGHHRRLMALLKDIIGDDLFI